MGTKIGFCVVDVLKSVEYKNNKRLVAPIKQGTDQIFNRENAQELLKDFPDAIVVRDLSEGEWKEFILNGYLKQKNILDEHRKNNPNSTMIDPLYNLVTYSQDGKARLITNENDDINSLIDKYIGFKLCVDAFMEVNKIKHGICLK